MKYEQYHMSGRAIWLYIGTAVIQPYFQIDIIFINKPHIWSLKKYILA